MTDKLCWEEQFNLLYSLLKCTELSGSHVIGILSFSLFIFKSGKCVSFPDIFFFLLSSHSGCSSAGTSVTAS